MTSKILSFASIALFAVSLFSCTPAADDPADVLPAAANVNTGDLRLFVVDTAKVNTITMTGTNETTILNRKVNSNSYISSLSLNGDASKIAYVDNQGGMVNNFYVPSKSVRIANASGSGDVAVYTAPANTNSVSNDIGFVKFGASKIYFTTTAQTFVGGAVGNLTKLNSVNFDGSGLIAENYAGNPQEVYKSDITTNGRYLATFQSAPNLPKFLVFDRTGDNGAGSVVYQENLTAASASGSPAVFSFDNKFVYFAFAENQSLKVRVVNMATLMAETKTIATNFAPASAAFSLSVASDNNRGVLTVQTFDNARSKSYVFNLIAGSSTSFSNNDENIYSLKAY